MGSWTICSPFVRLALCTKKANRSSRFDEKMHVMIKVNEALATL